MGELRSWLVIIALAVSVAATYQGSDATRAARDAVLEMQAAQIRCQTFCHRQGRTIGVAVPDGADPCQCVGYDDTPIHDAEVAR